MTSNKYLTLDDVTWSLTKLGGEANWSEIKDRIDETRSYPSYEPYKDESNYEKRMRQIVHIHCEGYAHYRGPERFKKVSKIPLRYRIINIP